MYGTGKPTLTAHKIIDTHSGEYMRRRKRENELGDEE